MKCSYCGKTATEAIFNGKNSIVGTPVCGQHSHELPGKKFNFFGIFMFLVVVGGLVLFFWY